LHFELSTSLVMCSGEVMPTAASQDSTDDDTCMYVCVCAACAINILQSSQLQQQLAAASAAEARLRQEAEATAAELFKLQVMKRSWGSA
jgi:ferredoxin